MLYDIVEKINSLSHEGSMSGVDLGLQNCKCVDTYTLHLVIEVVNWN